VLHCAIPTVIATVVVRGTFIGRDVAIEGVTTVVTISVADAVDAIVEGDAISSCDLGLYAAT
jgi:hypothetical protein